MWMILCVILWSSVASHAWAQKATSIEYQDVTIHNSRTIVHDGAFVNVNQSNSVGFDVQISGTATVKFRVSGPGRFGWNDLTCSPSNSATGVTSATATGFYQCNVATGDVVSARLDVCTACTVSVVARTSTAIYGNSGGGGGGGGGTSVTEDAQHVSGEAIVPLGCRRNGVAASSAATDGDWATVDCDSSGRVRATIDTAVAPTSFTPSDGCTLASEKINISSATTTTVVSSIASNYIKVYGLFFRVGSSGSNNVTVRDSTPTTLIDLLDFSAKESLFLPMQPTPWFSSATSTGLQIVTSTTAPVVGRVYYTQCTVAP